jgi:hypothetical protein
VQRQKIVLPACALCIVSEVHISALCTMPPLHGPEAGGSTQSQGSQKDKAHHQEGYRVVMPPPKFIPLSVSDIIDAMRNGIKHEDRRTFTEICQLVEGCATTEFSSLRRRVKKNYRFFSQAAMQRDLPTRKGRGSALPLQNKPASLLLRCLTWFCQHVCRTRLTWRRASACS